MEFTIRTQDDYDQKLNLRGQTVWAYSKKRLKKRLDGQEIPLAGETKNRNRKQAVGELLLGEDERLTVSEAGGHSRIFNRTAGYLHVEGDDRYIAVLKSRVPLLLLLLLLALGLAAGILLAVRLAGSPTTPAAVPPVLSPDPDPWVQPLEGDDSSKAPSESGGGSVSMSYTLHAALSLSDSGISMYFQNPNASNHDVQLELYILSGDEEVLIARSGLIRAGYGLYRMSMLEGSAVLSEGIYQGKYKVKYYDPQTGEKALVESDIADVTVTVSP